MNMNHINSKYFIEKSGNFLVVNVENLNYELENQNLLKSLEERSFSDSSNLIIDLERVAYINSMGLRFLISALKISKENNGTFRLVNVSPAVEKLIKITKLENIFLIYNDNQKAVA